MLTFILLLVVQGLIIGALARLALPGRDPMSIPQTILVGIGGSLIAGLIVYALTGGSRGPGFIAALLASMVIVYVIRRRRGGSLTSPGRAAHVR